VKSLVHGVEHVGSEIIHDIEHGAHQALDATADFVGVDGEFGWQGPQMGGELAIYDPHGKFVRPDQRVTGEQETTTDGNSEPVASDTRRFNLGNLFKAFKGGGQLGVAWRSAQMLDGFRDNAQSKQLTGIMTRYGLDKTDIKDWGAAEAYLQAEEYSNWPGLPLDITKGDGITNRRELVGVMLLERSLPGSFESAMMGDDTALQMYQGMLGEVRARPMPRKGVAYTTKNDSERRIADDMRVSGASSEAIQNALEVYRMGTNGTSAKVSSGAPSWLKVVQQGIDFNKAQRGNYKYNEVYLKGPLGGYVVVDSYDPTKGMIVSRKFTQLGGVQTQTALAYISEAAVKYAPGREVAKVPSTPPELAGTRLQGTLYLEVPVQKVAVPRVILDAAKRSNVVIRDINGKIYK